MEFFYKVGEAVGGAVVNIVVEKLWGKLESFSLPEDVSSKLQNCKLLLSKVQALLVDAEEKLLFNPKLNHPVNIWLGEVKNLIYDMEDLVDEFEIDASRSKRRKLTIPYNSTIHVSQTLSKVGSLEERWKTILEESEHLNLASSDNQAGYWSTVGRVPSTSLPEHVYGREEDKSAILQKILDSEGSSKGFSVVPILGMGGIGKTTLAQQVYNEVTPAAFELKAWVCVSDKFDVQGITRTILEKVGGSCSSNDLDSLQVELKSKLSNKKFLLVLDDVWNENPSSWDCLCKPFLSGAAGSKILVTTRNEHVAGVMGGKDRIHQLQLLKDKECLSILARRALGHESFDQHPNLKDVGEKLVKKCRGLPLVAKTLGGLLCGRLDPSDWSRISDSKIWELPENESDILPALRLSYLHLPSYLKPCFAYCAMFPKDYKFEKNELVLLWMAGGILKEPSEEVGHRYFSELVSRAFFQQLKGGESDCYVMHDLIHDLAQFISGEMCFDEERMLEVDEKSKVNLEKVRHLSFYPKMYDVSKRFEFLKEMRSLRTFFPATTSRWRVSRFFLSNEVVHDWLPKLKCLRALSLENYQIEKLPDSIGDLRCLTYLNLCHTAIKCLPESVGFLIRLQSLLLGNCEEFQKFPRTIGNLTELHHLDVMHTDSLKEMPVELSNLKNLVTMSKFIVGKTNESLRLYHLENFSRLRGELSILDLHNVMEITDATKANLGKFNGLHELQLDWTSDFSDSSSDYSDSSSDFSDSRAECNIELQVLSRLKPHPNLKSLVVVSYGGKEFSSWICDPSFSNLSDMELRNCKSCTSLPSLGLLPGLKKLLIEGMDAVKAVGKEFWGLNGTFPSLAELVFEDMLKWEEWTCPVGGSDIFPCLQKLAIYRCPMLMGELPNHLSSLMKLVINRCPKLRSIDRTSFPSCQELNIEYCEEMSMVDLTCFTRLESLRVEGCSSLQSFAGGKIPITLKYLEITECNNLESLPDRVLMQGGDIHHSNNNLPSLKEFAISDCDKLKSLSEGMLQQCMALESVCIGCDYEILKSFFSLGSCLSNLQRLQIYDIEGCESLPVMRLSLPNLKYFQMVNCSSIESIPDGGLLPNLLELSLCDCDNLKSLPKLGLSSPNLKKMEIQGCRGIECIPDGVLPQNLSELEIYACENLKSLPDSMILLESLQSLLISSCENLKSLPKSMDSLTSLQGIQIHNCSSIEFVADRHLPPNLARLELLDCDNLIKSLQNTMHELASLQELRIDNWNLMAGWSNLHCLTSLQNVKISKACPPDTVLPSSVISLVIDDLENEESIPKRLFQNLISLRSLIIYDCPKLQSLPNEAMPPSLECLQIIGCPLLKRQHFEAKGDYWPLTRNIPRVEIDNIRC